MLVISMSVCIFSFAARAEDRQYKIEAALLYSFFNYITWPGYSTPHELREPVICVYDKDPLLPYLDYIRNKRAAERTLTLRSIPDQDAAAGCHIFFIRHHISPRILASLPGSTLTILKPDDPLDRGGMIELSEEGEHISIKINQSQLEENGFLASSRLLALTRK